MKVIWPLVGRRRELNAIAALMDEGSGGVVIAGAAGVGKTRLAVECLSLAASRGFTPVRISATAGAAELPFGAFAHLLPELSDPIDQSRLLQRIGEAIREQGDEGPVAIMVDDAHLLDASSAALTHRLIEDSDTFVVATLRSGEQTPEPILVLWKDGLVERLELHPLSDPEIEQLLHSALGGPVDGVAVEILKGRAAGNALFLRELILGALESGTLSERAGVWRLVGELELPDRLTEIVESRLTALDPPHRRAAELLACGEPLGMALFRLLAPGVDLENLERMGILRVEPEGRRTMLRLHHPLQADVLRSGMSALARRRTARAIAEAIEKTGARRRADALAVASSSLEAGGPYNPRLMLQAARMARMSNNLPLAERLARAAVEAGLEFDAELLLAQLHWHQGRPLEADHLLRQLEPKARTDRQRAELANAHADVLHLGLGNSDEALRVAQAAERTIEDLALRDELVAGRARILGRRGENARAAAVVEPLLDRADGVALVNACLAAGTSMPVTGQFELAMKATALGYTTHHDLGDTPVGLSPQIHRSLRCLALLLAGYPEEAWNLGMAEYERAVGARSLDAQGFFSLNLAATLLAQGRPATAERFAGEAVGVFRQTGWGFMQRLSLIDLVMARAMRGRVGEARAGLRELDGLAIAETDLWGPRLLQSRAWVEVAAGNLAGAVDLLWRSVAMGRSSGARVLSCAALHDLARLGNANEAAGILSREAVGIEGRMAPLQSSHAGALDSGSPDELDEISTAWEEMGALLLAAESARSAAVAWRRSGNRRRATRAELRSGLLHERCEGAVTPALSTSLPAQADLTPRELEVARLAARGHSDRTIAGMLYLSPRTVGNALHSAYGKLGVEGRAGLAAALAGPDESKDEEKPSVADSDRLR